MKASFELHSYIFSCLFNISSWMSQRYSRLSLSPAELVTCFNNGSLLLVLFPSWWHHCPCCCTRKKLRVTVGNSLPPLLLTVSPLWRVVKSIPPAISCWIHTSLSCFSVGSSDWPIHVPCHNSNPVTHTSLKHPCFSVTFEIISSI